MPLCGKQLKSMVPVGEKLVKPPRNAKELMATRLLEGHFVRCSSRGVQVWRDSVLMLTFLLRGSFYVALLMNLVG